MGYLKVYGIGTGKMVRFYFKVFVAKVLFLGGIPNSICHFSCPSVRPSRTISQEPYIIYSQLLVHVCKMMYLQAFFLFFQNFNFWVVSTVKTIKRYKKVHISETIHRMIIIYDTCVK